MIRYLLTGVAAFAMMASAASAQSYHQDIQDRYQDNGCLKCTFTGDSTEQLNAQQLQDNQDNYSGQNSYSSSHESYSTVTQPHPLVAQAPPAPVYARPVPEYAPPVSTAPVYVAPQPVYVQPQPVYGNPVAGGVAGGAGGAAIGATIGCMAAPTQLPHGV